MEDTLFENAELKGKPKKDILKHVITYGCLGELNYLNQVVMEALRFRPPVACSTQIFLSEDTKIGRYNIKANDILGVNITGLHFNKNEW